MPVKSLEIRINSISDAKAAVADMVAIHNEAKHIGVNSIHFIIAREVQKEAQAILYGVFRFKSFTKIVEPEPGNKLYVLEHLEKAEFA